MTGGASVWGVDRVERSIRTMITAGEIITTGIVHPIRKTVVASVVDVRDVGGEIGVTTVRAVRGAITAGAEIGGDLGALVKQALKRTVQATAEIGGEVGRAVHSAAARIGAQWPPRRHPHNGADADSR